MKRKGKTLEPIVCKELFSVLYVLQNPCDTLFSETSLLWLSLTDGIAFTILKSGHALKSTEISGGKKKKKHYLGLWTRLVVPKEVSPDHCSAGKLCFPNSLS